MSDDEAATGSRWRPQVRGRYMRTFIDAIDKLEPPERDEIRRRIGRDDLDAIASSGAVAWLDGGIDLRCTEAVCDVLGQDGYRRFFRGLLTLVYDTSLFATFIRGIVRLFGRDLAAYCRWVDRGFGLAFRNVGRWSVAESSKTHALLQIRELPAAFANDRYWIETVVGSLWSLIDLAQVEGTVSIAQRVRDGADYELRWKPRA